MQGHFQVGRTSKSSIRVVGVLLALGGLGSGAVWLTSESGDRPASLAERQQQSPTPGPLPHERTVGGHPPTGQPPGERGEPAPIGSVDGSLEREGDTTDGPSNARFERSIRGRLQSFLPNDRGTVSSVTCDATTCRVEIANADEEAQIGLINGIGQVEEMRDGVRSWHRADGGLSTVVELPRSFFSNALSIDG